MRGASLDGILSCFPTYRDLLNYKVVLHAVEKQKSSPEAALLKFYPDGNSPVKPPITFTWKQLDSLITRVTARLKLLDDNDKVCVSLTSDERRQLAWSDLQQYPSRTVRMKLLPGSSSSSSDNISINGIDSPSLVPSINPRFSIDLVEQDNKHYVEIGQRIDNLHMLFQSTLSDCNARMDDMRKKVKEDEKEINLLLVKLSDNWQRHVAPPTLPRIM